MRLYMSQRLRREEGFTVVELLVVIVLLGIVMSIATGSVITALQSQRRQVDQTHRLNEAKIAFERVTRDLRAANPLLQAEEDEVRMQITVDDLRRTVTYTLEPSAAGGQLLRLTEQRQDLSTNPATDLGTTDRVMLDRIMLPAGTPLFAFANSAEEALPCTAAMPVSAADVWSVTLRLRLEPRESPAPIDLDSTVHLRNARNSSC